MSSPTVRRDHWDSLWKDGIPVGAKFDAKFPLPHLVHQLTLSNAIPTTGRVLIPGCGRGYDIQLFASTAQYDQVIGLEISETAAKTALDYLSSLLPPLTASYRVQVADFFTYTDDLPFDIVYDYTFLCAIEPHLRPLWAQCMKRLVRKGGALITAIFPLGKEPDLGGPPFGLTIELYRQLLEKDGAFQAADGPFVLENDMAHPGRGDGQTGWAVWRRAL